MAIQIDVEGLITFTIKNVDKVIKYKYLGQLITIGKDDHDLEIKE